MKEIVAKQGAKNGSQYLKIIRSAFSPATFLPVLIQFNGFTESTQIIFLSSGILNKGSSCSYCVLPGKNISGYCLLNEYIFTSLPVEKYLYRSALN